MFQRILRAVAGMFAGSGGQTSTLPAWLYLSAMLLLIPGCLSPAHIEDPIAELHSPGAFPSRQVMAMDMLDEEPTEAYISALHRMIWVDGFTKGVREEAVNRLERHDPDGLRRTIRRHLPRMTAWGWLTRLTEIIAERGWHELTPALVSSWSRPTPFIPDEADRPERKALVALYGEQNIDEVVFNLFVESRSVAEQGLRTRCWQLLHRLGLRDRLIELVAGTEPPADDAMLVDLHAAARDFGVVPHNREEILWLRMLRQPERAEFWSQAAAAVPSLPSERRTALEVRDIPIVVAAYRHDPDLLTQTDEQLYTRLDALLKPQRHHDARTGMAGMYAGMTGRLHQQRDNLMWGDLAAMLLALRAFDVPEMVDHLFDYAERDMRDDTTEYGGIVNLDERGRFELLEFPPTVRHHDNKFIASQSMMDAGYTGLFHFHYHVQRPRNTDHAGPGFGDLQYADNTRANCLVFTFINENTLNIDFYRHSGMVVDLGEIRRR